MPKKKKRKYRSKLDRPSKSTPTSTQSQIHPNATLGPDASIEPPSSVSWGGKESTSVPDIGEESKTDDKYASSHTALIDKYILRKLNIPSLIILAFAGLIFIQDNKAGHLTDWKAIFWSLQKCLPLIGIFIVLLFIQWLVNTGKNTIE